MMRRVALTLALLALWALPSQASLMGRLVPLQFTAGGTTRVVGNSTTTLKNITAGSIVAVIKSPSYPDGSAVRGIFSSNANSTGFRNLIYGPTAGANAIRFSVNRATTSLLIEVSSANLVYGAANKWFWVAATWNTGGTNGQQLLYSADATSPFTAVTSYVTQQVGTGSPTESNGAWELGNLTTSSGMNGQIALVYLWDQYFAPGDLNEFKTTLNPRYRHCLAGWVPGRNGTGGVIDLCGNNNNGTITGAVPTSDVPPFFGFRRAA